MSTSSSLGEIEGLIRGSAPGNRDFTVGKITPYLEALNVGAHGCERMEFLGDAVLSVIVTQYLYDRFPSSREGFLSKMRSKIVSARMLTQLAASLGVEKHVSPSTSIDDILEALIAAISIDRGMREASDWFINVLEHHVDLSALVSRHDSYKQQLTNLCGPLTFTRLTSVPGTVLVCLKDAVGAVLGTASACNRRDAEEDASRKALAAMVLTCPVSLPRHAMAKHVIQTFG